MFNPDFNDGDPARAFKDGLISRLTDPEKIRDFSISDHLTGKKDSPWISTTEDPKIALEFAFGNTGNPRTYTIEKRRIPGHSEQVDAAVTRGIVYKIKPTRTNMVYAMEEAARRGASRPEMARQLEWAALYKIDPANIAEVKIYERVTPLDSVTKRPVPGKMGEVNESLRPITINGQDYRGAKTNPNFNADHQGFDVDDIPGFSAVCDLGGVRRVSRAPQAAGSVTVAGGEGCSAALDLKRRSQESDHHTNPEGPDQRKQRVVDLEDESIDPQELRRKLQEWKPDQNTRPLVQVDEIFDQVRKQTHSGPDIEKRLQEAIAEVRKRHITGPWGELNPKKVKTRTTLSPDDLPDPGDLLDALFMADSLVVSAQGGPDRRASEVLLDSFRGSVPLWQGIEQLANGDIKGLVTILVDLAGFIPGIGQMAQVFQETIKLYHSDQALRNRVSQLRDWEPKAQEIVKARDDAWRQQITQLTQPTVKTLIEGFVNSDAVKAHLSARATARASQQILNLSLLAKMPVDQLSDAAVSSWNQAHPQQQLDRHAAWSQRAQQLADILGGDAAVSDADAALIREATEALPEHLRAHAAFTERYQAGDALYKEADEAIKASFDQLIRTQVTEIGGSALIDSYAKEIEKMFSRDTQGQPYNLRGAYAQWNAAYFNIFEDYAWKTGAYEEKLERTIAPLWRQKDVANPAYPAYAQMRPYLRTPPFDLPGFDTQLRGFLWDQMKPGLTEQLGKLGLTSKELSK
ncbi:hypothetical protein [Streptomyces sp. NPDC001635]